MNFLKRLLCAIKNVVIGLLLVGVGALLFRVATNQAGILSPNPCEVRGYVTVYCVQKEDKKYVYWKVIAVNKFDNAVVIEYRLSKLKWIPIT